MSNLCSELKQRCKEVREEVYGHLTALESGGIPAILCSYSLAVALLGLVVAVAGYMLHVLQYVLQPLPASTQIAPVVVVAITLGPITYAAFELLHTSIKLKSSKFIKELFNLSKGVLEEYLKILEDYCKKGCGCGMAMDDLKALLWPVRAMEISRGTVVGCVCSSSS